MFHSPGIKIVQNNQRPGLIVAIIKCPFYPAIRVLPITWYGIPQNAGVATFLQKLIAGLRKQVFTNCSSPAKRTE